MGYDASGSGNRWIRGGAMRCTGCGEGVSEGDAYCITCGKPLTQTPPSGGGDEEHAGRPAQCAVCGAELLRDAAFCTTCGHGVVRRRPEPASVTAVEFVDPREEGGPVDESRGPAICASCGRDMGEGLAFCPACGSAVVAGPPLIESSVPRVVSATCASCGAALSEGALYCIQCGRPVAPADIADVAPSALEGSSAFAPAPLPGSVHRCATCGGVLQAGAEYCTVCGTPAGRDASDTDQIRASDAVEVATGSERQQQTGDRQQQTGDGDSPIVSPADVPAAFCIMCGNRLEPDDQFCIKCGLARNGFPHQATESREVVVSPDPPQSDVVGVDSPETQKERKRSFMALWIVLGVLLVTAASLIGWLLLSDGGGTAEPDPDSETTIAATGDTDASQPEATAPAGGSDVDTGDEAVCQAAADDAIDATVALMQAFSAGSLGDVITAARIGRDSMPVASSFDTRNADLTAAGEEAGCVAADQEARYAAALADVTTPPDAAGRVVYHAAGIAYGFDSTDLLTRVTAALRLYPIHSEVDVGAATSHGLPKWTVILESLDVADHSQAEALANLSAYGGLGVETGVFLSDDYGSLNSGYWVIFAGMFDSHSEAVELCASIRSNVDFCYDRYLQDVPTTTGPNGACGPYGRFDVVGVDSTSLLTVYVGPSTGQKALGTYTGSDTGILSAGPPTTVGSTDWTPVEIHGRVGWAESRYLSEDPACAGLTPEPPTATSCPAVAVATAQLLQSIVSAVEDAEASGVGAVASLDVAVFDTQAESLVSDAAANGCDVAGLNDLVAAQYGTIEATGGYAGLVLEILTADDFFAEG
jgi:hypothetical protein